MSPVLQTLSHITSSLLIFAFLIGVTGVVALLTARVYGGGSRVKRRLLFTIINAVGLLAAATYTILRLRGHG